MRTLRRKRSTYGNRDFPHDLRALTRLAKDQGFEVQAIDTHRSRFRNARGDSRVVTYSREPRSILNIISTLRHLGLKPAHYAERAPLTDERARTEPQLVPVAPVPLTAPLLELIQSTATDEDHAMLSPQHEHANGNGISHGSNGGTSAPPDRRRVILRAIERTDHGAGVHPKTILDQVHVHFPDLSLKNLQTTFGNYGAAGYLTARGDGKHSVSDQGRSYLLNAESFKLTRKPRTARAKVIASTPELILPDAASVDEDVRLLDAALAALSDLERVIKRHRDIAVSCAQLKQVLGAASALMAPKKDEPA